MASQILANLKQQVAEGGKEGQQKIRPHHEVKARTATALRVNELSMIPISVFLREVI